MTLPELTRGRLIPRGSVDFESVFPRYEPPTPYDHLSHADLHPPQRDYGSMMELVERLYPLNRALASEDMDRAISIVSDALPDYVEDLPVEKEVEAYDPGEEAWTWTIPPRWELHEAFLETADGERVLDIADSPLAVVSYSRSVDEVLDWDALEPHLCTSPRRPDAMPYEYSFYDDASLSWERRYGPSKEWGFSLPHRVYESLDREARYHARIDAHFDREPGGFRLLSATVPPDRFSNPLDVPRPIFLVTAHLDHPFQANDNLSGVAVAVELANTLAERPLPTASMDVRFLFGPETIGTLAHLHRHRKELDRYIGGLNFEVVGHDGRLTLQRSADPEDDLNGLAVRALAGQRVGFGETPFLVGPRGDNLVMNGPGVGIPCVELTRGFYPEYHTEDDTPGIISERRLREVVDASESLVRMASQNGTWRLKQPGPVMLSRYNLWPDWREAPRMNRNMDRLMMMLDGTHSPHRIAKALGMDYWDVVHIIRTFWTEGLVELLPR